MTNLPRFAVRYPVTVAMIMLGVAILGYISLDRLGTDLLPSVYNPKIVVDLRAGDRAPLEMEQRFARQLEGELSTISNVVDVQTLCSLGRLVATITFSWGADMDFALLDVQKKVSRFESDPVVQRVIVARYDPQAEPISVYAFEAGAERDLDELRRLGEEVFKRDLERLDGVARVEVYGGEKREVRVELDSYLLDAFGLSPAEVIGQIRDANADASGGNLVQDNTSYLVKGVGKFASIEEVRETVVGYKDGAAGANGDTTLTGMQQAGTRYSTGKVPIFLKDVAAVSYAEEERRELVRLNGSESVGLYIYKEPQDNTVRVARQADDAIAGLQAGLQDIRFTRIYSQAEFIDTAIGEVKTTAVIGVILAVLVLYFFLRDPGATVVVGLAIPLSVLATFTLMYFQGFTLNIMTLGGLALGAGMLVDNAIIVIENIYRRRNAGESSSAAAVAGTNQVGVAILASTFTTIVVFLPIVYVEGIAAELFREQAWVVAFSLFSSMFVAFLLIPMLASRFASDKALSGQRKLRIPAYERLLGHVVDNPKRVVLAALLMLVASAALLPIVGAEFVPRSAEHQLEIDLVMQPGIPVERSGAILEEVEHRVNQVLGESVAHIYATTNVSAAQDLFRGGSNDDGSRSRLLVTLSRDPDSINPERAAEQLRPVLNLPEIETALRVRQTNLQQSIGTGGAPLIVEVRGEDLALLQQVSDRIADAIRQSGGMHSAESSIQAGRPEIAIKVNRLVAASFGLDVQQVGARVRERLAGEEASSFYGDGDDRAIRVAFPQATLAELQELPVRAPDGAVLRLRDFATLERTEGPKEVLRRGQTRVAYVSAQLAEGVRLSDAVARLSPLLEQIPLPPGYEIRYSGEEAKRTESFIQLRFALLLSVLLVYMVLASLFESFLHPFTILLTLPLAGVGVVFAFLLTGEPLSVMAYIGIIMLAGIAANDSIILVDYINRLRLDGLSRREAILQAARDRMRPILMTSATTILALLPLTIGFGESARLRAPMAIAVIGGLVSSTILTLVIIPAVYELIDRLRRPESERAQRIETATES